MSDPNDGVPGQEAEPTVLTSSDTIKEIIVAGVSTLGTPLLYLLIPPLYLYRGRPVLDRLMKWRWVYAAFLLMASIVSGVQLLAGGAPTTLLFAPVFHLVLAAGILVLAVAVVPGVSSSSGALPIALVLGITVLLMFFSISWYHSGIENDVETDKVHLNPAADEYIIPMTEVWKNGGKHDD